MKLEGKAQDLITLENKYLGIISGSLTGKIDFDRIRKNARAIVKAAAGKPVYDFGARHFAPGYIKTIAEICHEEGFAGCSTDIGAKAWGSKGVGTIPHALILIFAAHIQEKGSDENPTVETAKAFNRNIDKSVPRILLADTFNREVSDTINTIEAVPNFTGVRIDTCGENVPEFSTYFLPYSLLDGSKYLRGKGVTIDGIWALRETLNRKRFDNIEITVSSGFNIEKTTAFIKADKSYQRLYGKPLFNSIGTGSLAKVIPATSDIYAYFSEKQNKWLPLSKTGRSEVLTDRLERVR